jgi:hypothetical protein
MIRFAEQMRRFVIHILSDGVFHQKEVFWMKYEVLIHRKNAIKHQIVSKPIIWINAGFENVG